MGDQRPEEVDPEKHGKWNREWGDLKPKDLLLMPHRIAMALQADGWWVRSDIVWAKGSVMPESIRDRPTRSHESVFLLAKSRHYFYDCDAIREPISTQPQGRETNEAASDEGRPDHRKSSMSYRYDGVPPGNPSGRNKRTVWNINPRPYPGAHFACWPPELVEVMVKAGSSEHGVCGVCGAPWARQVAREERPVTEDAVQPNQRDGELHAEHGIERTGLTHFRYNQWLQANPAVTVGWEPTCDHVDASINRAIVLDPFSGSATTGMVALQLGRDYVGIDLQVSYLKLAEARIQGLKPPGEAVEAEAGDIFDLFGGP
jgi:DNA modification methylase